MRTCTAELLRTIDALTQLAELKLSGCRESPDIFPHLAGLRGLRKLGMLDMSLTNMADDMRGVPAESALLCSVAACASLVHLHLDGLGSLAGLKLEALPQLVDLHLWCLRDGSLQQRAVAAPPFLAADPACRCGLRALPHLQQLTALRVMDAYEASLIEFCILGAVLLLLLLRLARLRINGGSLALGERTMTAGVVCASAA